MVNHFNKIFFCSFPFINAQIFLHNRRKKIHMIRTFFPHTGFCQINTIVFDIVVFAFEKNFVPVFLWQYFLFEDYRIIDITIINISF